MKAKPLSHVAKAEARIVAILVRGEILTVADFHGCTYTVGPHTPAVGIRGLYSVYGYGRHHHAAAPDREAIVATDAAAIIVARVGAGRAREAAIDADKRAGRTPAKVVAGTVSRRGEPTPIVVYA